MATTDPSRHGRLPMRPTAIALSLMVGVAQLAIVLVWPSIAQEGEREERILDLFYLVAVIVSIVGWAGVLIWSVVALRPHDAPEVVMDPGRPTGLRLLPWMSLGVGILGLGLLLSLLYQVTSLSVGEDSAWLPVLAQSAASAVLVAVAYPLRRGSPQSPR